MPTFRSSKLSLSNFSGVSLLRMLQGGEKSARNQATWSIMHDWMEQRQGDATYPRTFLKIASWCSEVAGRFPADLLTLLGGTHLRWASAEIEPAAEEGGTALDPAELGIAGGCSSLQDTARYRWYAWRIAKGSILWRRWDRNFSLLQLTFLRHVEEPHPFCLCRPVLC